MKHNPDDRRDNVERIQRNISNTIENMELTDETIAKTDDETTRRNLSRKNDRREDALESMRKEIKDEAIDRRRGYKD
ncbi:MAG TPA: small acid-soluble spore protein Tlp [Syntrophomonadaceae bacterium]|nr:small acid-soluble spore protein Tlp [Syntrophomonadaceae bacterium]